MDKLTIKMGADDHPDVLFEQALIVRKKYRRRRTKPTWDELISCVVTGATPTYQALFTAKMLEMDGEPNGQIVLSDIKTLGNELYMANSLSTTKVKSEHETSLCQFNKRSDHLTQEEGIQCF